MSTPTTWSSAGSTDANLAGNYSAGLPADAVVTLNATSVINWTFTAGMSVESVTITGAYSGAVSLSGQTLTVSLGISFDGTGTYNLGNGITANGNSSTVHFGAGMGVVTATSCVITMNGTTAMVLDDDKAITFLSLTLGASAIVINSGAAMTTYSRTGTPLTIGNNATLTVNRTVLFICKGTGNSFHSIGTGVTINGNANITWTPGVNGDTLNFPAYTYSGTGINDITSYFGNTNDIIQLSGNLNTGIRQFRVFTNGTAVFTFTTQNYSITCGTYTSGGSAGTPVLNLNYGSSVVSIVIFDGATWNLGTINQNLQTSTWSCSGNWAFGSNHTITGTAATTSVTITNTSSVTSNGKQFPGSFIVNAAAKTITMVDAISIVSAFTLTAGTLTTATFAVTVVGNVQINGTSTLTASGSTCTFGGDYTTVAGSTITINAATNYTFTKNGAIVTTNGKALPQCTFNANFTINDSCTITRLIRGVDGFTGTFEAGQTFTISNLAAANWSGAVAALNAVRSSIPGTQFTIVMPNAVTLTFYDSQDCIYQGFDVTANDGTSITRGNNVRYLTMNVVTVLPVTGSIAGGTTLTFSDTGNGMGGVCVVTVGGVGAGAETVVNTQSLTAVTPAGAIGAVNVVITNGDGDTRTLIGGFTYVAPASSGDGSGASRCYISSALGI